MQAGPREISRRQRDSEADERNTSIPGVDDWSSNRIDNGSSNASPGHGMHSTSDISNTSRLFSTANETTNVTSFESNEDGAFGMDKEEAQTRAGSEPFVNEMGEHNPAILGSLADATTVSLDPSHPYHSWTNPSREEGILQNQNLSSTLSSLPKDVLQRIFVTVATRSYAARLSLPLVCRAFHSAVLGCPKMWDTFEVMTGNDGALTSKSQVEYLAAKAGSMPLHIGLMIASSRIGAWRSDPLPPWSDEGLNESARSAQTLQIQGLNMVGTILSLMPRVEDFILDVQEDPLDPALARAVLALFDDHLAGGLKRLTLLGDYQMDRIVRLTTPLTGAPSLIQPSLASLRHLSVAYCSAFTLPGPLHLIETLEISIISIETTPISYPLEECLFGFPNLRSLEIRITIDSTGPEVITLLGISPNQRESPEVVLERLEKLVLESLPLTSSLLSSLIAPNLQTLTLQQLTLGLDPREVRYETSLSGHLNLAEESDGEPAHSNLQSLPLGIFLARQARNGKLRAVSLGGIPDMVVRMCVDFVRMAGGTGSGPGGGDRGLRGLSLLGFEWRDWESLFILPLSPTVFPGDVPTTLTDGASPLPIPLPFIRTISVFLDHTSTWTSKGTVVVNYEAKYDREGWMDGLMQFAERRMNVQAVVRMFKESKMDVADWMETLQENRGDWQGAGDGIHGDPLRTVMSIELDAGYKDSYAFVHGAWKAMEKTEMSRAAPELAEPGVLG